MPRFSANLTMMFNEVDFPDRFARASGAGFEAVEYMFPYDWPKEQLAGALESNEVVIKRVNSLFNFVSEVHLSNENRDIHK